ncbi:Aspartic peptidase [Trema orientale]|uniref:Aspartic peptidase n=1 Tax=Trema orientale TaxID=63057 RepID=A0A2P5FRN5_TREOI|nr:Aspartic peptidase [Trema orientale]
MDTGSGLIWTQCKPCVNCFMIPLPTESFHVITPFAVSFINASMGDVSQPERIKDVVFGCSNDNQNFTFDSISGILGLSYSPDSLATQLGKSIEKRFSYCFPYSYSSMTLNSDDVVWGFREELSPSKQNSTGGCVIDNGCVLSFLDEKPYWAVMREFEAQFRRIGLERVWNLMVGFELCYRHVAENVNANVDFDGYDVSLTFHFEGADFEALHHLTKIVRSRKGDGAAVLPLYV